MSLKLVAVPALWAEEREVLDGLARTAPSVAEVPGADSEWSPSRIREGLLDGSLDLGLVPSGVLTEEGIATVAVLKRDEPRDVVVADATGSATLAHLPAGARVGLVGARRLGLLRAHRPDLRALALTNGHTPAAALESGEVDALILGAAQSRRLGLSERTTEFLDPKAWVPAPGQGAVTLVARADDEAARGAVAPFDHTASRRSWACELALSRALGTVPDAPLGALALPFGRWLRLWSMVTSIDGSRVARADLTGSADDPEGLGRAVADLLLMREAGSILGGAAS